MSEPMAFQNSAIYKALSRARHGVIITIGTGQWGKTVATHSVIESGVFGNRNVALVNYPPAFLKNYAYPSKYRAVKWPSTLEEVPKILRPSSDVVVFDDAVFLMGARDHASRENKAIQKLTTIASHHELFIMITIQNASLLDIGLMQSQDVYLLHKKMDVLSLQYERPELKTRQIIANSLISRYMTSFRTVHPKAWTYCSTTHEMLAMDMPPWWHPAMSKPFYGVIPS